MVLVCDAMAVYSGATNICRYRSRAKKMIAKPMNSQRNGRKDLEDESRALDASDRLNLAICE